MARLLSEDLGRGQVWHEERSLTTAGNAEQTARQLRARGIGHLILVTSAYHMVRASAEFRATGLRVTEAPVGSPGAEGGGDGLGWIPSAYGNTLTSHAPHEIVGRVGFRIRSWWRAAT